MSTQPPEYPYEQFYKPQYGSILGRPLPFNPKADPNQRVYQETMLRNNTIVRFTPGKYKYDSDAMDKAKAVLDNYVKEMKNLENTYANDPDKKLKEVADLNSRTNAAMIKDNLDLRYLSFEPAIAEFYTSLQLLINKAATSIFSRSSIGSVSPFTTDIAAAMQIGANASAGGFNVWVEKQTSISESVSNSFTSSVFENLVNKGSRFARELGVAGVGTGIDMKGMMGGSTVHAPDAEGAEKSFIEKMGAITNIASSAMSGAKVILPSIWDDSKFSRSYNISFRFMSPYGDDRSIMDNVIIPFLFILTLSLPRQVGVSGMGFPFLVQADCPGYFSTPMGVIDNISFVKGGSEQLWSDSGLPLAIEGTFSVIDLYNNLSLPMNNAGFVTNLGTAAFITNLVGGKLYSALDPTIKSSLANYVKGGLNSAMLPVYNFDTGVARVARYAGLYSDDGGSGMGSDILTSVSNIGNKIGSGVNSFLRGDATTTGN